MADDLLSDGELLEVEDDFDDGELSDDVAVVGMACRFPGAADVDEYWRNLAAGVESISRFSAAEVEASGVDPALVGRPDYVRARGVLAGVEELDAPFFGLTPREAAIADPQQRLFLECAWQALEDAGWARPGDARVGVFAGSILSTYLLRNLLGSGRQHPADVWQMALFNDKDTLATQTSYRFDLRGPAVSVQTACSTSLVAVHLARQSLLGWECDLALAGGVAVRLPQRSGYLYQPDGIHSPDGRCRPFDAAARGTVFSNGAGVVVLKRLDDALRDGDTVHAVIKSSAINNDGAAKVGYTAPGADGQADVITRALALAEIDPATVGIVEAHGTATPLGDPIEVAALTQAFRAHSGPSSTGRTGFCALGSVKGNVGHLDAAAGIAGLIKAVLALEHETVPPSPWFERPNPQLALESSPFFVNREARPWPRGATPRRAGVSAFGIGGTNAHVVLEEAPLPAAAERSRPWQLLRWSARTPAALERATELLHRELERRARPTEAHRTGDGGSELADIAFTLAQGRRDFPWRRAAVCRDLADAVSVLGGEHRDRLLTAGEPASTPAVAFLFPGQGAQHVDMGRQLYEQHDAFRDAIDQCAELLAPTLGRDLRAILYPGLGHASLTAEEAAGLLARTDIAQPALFAVELALARQWSAWGVRPQAMLGHSLGELVAAHLAGVFSLEDALAVVAARGRLMQSTASGAMLAVSLGEPELLPLLGDALALAAVNAPGRCVVSGPGTGVATLARELSARGVESQQLATVHAFHSPAMDEALAPFARHLAEVRLEPPSIPFLSNVTGAWIQPEEATDPGYWCRQLRATVRFGDALSHLFAEPDRLLLEVGPGRTLTSLANRHPQRAPGQRAVASLPHRRDPLPEAAAWTAAYGRLWLAGVPVEPGALHAGERRRRVRLPTYPFERQRHWIEAGGDAGDASARGVESRDSIQRRSPDDWLYLPSWLRGLTPRPLSAAATPEVWLLLVDGTLSLAEALAQRLQQLGYTTVRVRATPGEPFSEHGAGVVGLDPARGSDYDTLARWLRDRGLSPRHALHLWSFGPPPEDETDPATFDAVQVDGFDAVWHLAHALTRHGDPPPERLTVVASHLHRVVAGDRVSPSRASLLGLCRSLGRAGLAPGFEIRAVDVDDPADDSTAAVDRILAEAASPQPTARRPVLGVAYRGSDRWQQVVEPVQFEGRELTLRERGVYLLTGGLGPAGFALTRRLAGLGPVRLLFLEPAPIAHDDPRQDSLRTLEELGAEVRVAAPDLTDAAAVRRCLAEARAAWGPVHGVLHLAPATGAAEDPAGPDAPAAARAVQRRKTFGAVVLDAALAAAGNEQPQLDFFVLFSSLDGLLGLRRQAGHCAAATVLDALAQERARQRPGTTLTIDWGQGLGRRDLEIAGDAGADLTADEAFATFLRLAGSCSAPQIAVSAHDVDTLALRDPAQDPAPAAPAARGDRPAYRAPEDELTATLAAAWQEVLGVERIGLDDHFFELGGDSLAGARLTARLRDTFPIAVDVQMLFTHPTLAGLSAAIEEAITTALESLSDEEAQQLAGETA